MASPALGLEDRVYGPADLAAYPIIGMKPKSFHYSAIEDWFQNEHVRARYLARCKSVAVAASMTTAGMGVAYLPAKNYGNELESGRLKIVKTFPRLEPVPFVAVFPLGHSFSLARTVAELAREVSTFDQK
jgi:DNA-binding transcriptional LysR family regulator